MSEGASPQTKPMENPALTRDLVEWIRRKERTYDEVMSAWRTSCPRLPIWEDAVDHGFVRVCKDPSHPRLLVSVTEAGLAFLAQDHR